MDIKYPDFLKVHGITSFPHPNETSQRNNSRNGHKKIYYLPSSAETCQISEICGIHGGSISFSYNMIGTAGQTEGTQNRQPPNERLESVLLSHCSATIEFNIIPNQEHGDRYAVHGRHDQDFTQNTTKLTLSENVCLQVLAMFLTFMVLIIIYPIIILTIIVIFSLYLTSAVLYSVLRHRDGHNIRKYFTICKYLLKSFFKQSRDKLCRWLYFCDRLYEYQGCNNCLNALEFATLHFVLGIVSILSFVCAIILIIVGLVPVLALICVLNICSTCPSDKNDNT